MATDNQRLVVVACEGADRLAIEEITPFQGDLKNLTAENYAKLKATILRHGFSSPIHVWRNGGKNWCLDGHQRTNTLKAMKSEGYSVPDLPVVYVDAVDKKQAKEKILALTSQYGQMTEEGLSDFMIDAGLDFSFLEEFTRFPELNMGSFDDPKEPTDSSKELDLDEFDSFDHKCPKCGFEWDTKNES